MEWEDYIKLAQILDELYPLECPINMSKEDLAEKVKALPEFLEMKHVLEESDLRYITRQWMELRGDEIYVEPYVDPEDDEIW